MGIILEQYDLIHHFLNLIEWNETMTTSSIKMPEELKIFTIGKMYTCEESKLINVVILCTDPLQNNEYFEGVVIYSLGASAIIGQQKQYPKKSFHEFRGEVTLKPS